MRMSTGDSLKNIHLALRASVSALALLACITPHNAFAQAGGIRLPLPTANATRIDIGEAPVIDADLSEPAWQRAHLLEPMRQVSPDFGAEATERTDVRIMYDENNLYFGIYAYDSVPDAIAVRAMARDGDLGSGDTVRIILDPGMTRRDAYTFQLGPSGGRLDALLQNNVTNLVEWDTIWDAEARVMEDGYIIEVAIPFRSLSYEPGAAEWGFEFTRQIRHKNETVRWSNYSPRISFTDVSQAGTLRGIEDVSQGLGLDLQVYGIARIKHDRQGADRTSPSGTIGGNAYYKITPALTGTLTVNPDFSDAPLDARQVNTTRFSLFTPETRDFFLQDASAFEFGGRNFVEGNNARPFFSRNIGLIEGRPVSILAGGKISGDYGGFGIGALSVYTNETSTTPAQLLSAARVTRRVLAESRAGFIFTNGDPTGRTDNTLLGGDFQYRDTNLFGEYVFEADTFYQRSFSSRFGDDDSFGVSVGFPNEPWGGELDFKQVGTDFRPALGFANRRGIRQYNLQVGNRRRFRDSYLQELGFLMAQGLVTDLRNHLETRESVYEVDFVNDQDDSLELGVRDYFEDVPEPFDLPNDVPIPAGDYNWTNFTMELETSASRIVALELGFACCSFYDGDGIEVSAEVPFRPNQYFELIPGYEGTFLDVPAGRVDIHLFSLDSVINITPDMQFAMQAQYDNISEGFGFLGRYSWEFLPGSELFVAIGQSAVVPERRIVLQTTQFSVRVGHTFRL
jgi:hypothetical protein